jgi:hypothetical protein
MPFKIYENLELFDVMSVWCDLYKMCFAGFSTWLCELVSTLLLVTVVISNLPNFTALRSTMHANLYKMYNLHFCQLAYVSFLCVHSYCAFWCVQFAQFHSKIHCANLEKMCIICLFVNLSHMCFLWVLSYWAFEMFSIYPTTHLRLTMPICKMCIICTFVKCLHVYEFLGTLLLSLESVSNLPNTIYSIRNFKIQSNCENNNLLILQASWENHILFWLNGE